MEAWHLLPDWNGSWCVGSWTEDKGAAMKTKLLRGHSVDCEFRLRTTLHSLTTVRAGAFFFFFLAGMELSTLFTN